MKNSKKNLFCAVLLAAAAFSCLNKTYAQESSSQKLINVLPDDVLFFAVTSGGDALKPAFEKTIMGRIWNDPSVKTFAQSIQDSVMQKAQDQPGAPQIKNIFSMALNIAGTVGSRPVIAGAAQKAAQNGPPVYGFAFMDAGAKKNEISGLLTNLEAMAPQGEIIDVKVGSYTFHGPKDNAGVPGYWGWIGDYLVFAINDGDGLAIKNLQGGTASQTKNYFERPVGADDIVAFYLNFEKGLSLAKSLVAMEGGQAEFAKVENVLSQLGIDKLKTITSRAGFAGTGIVGNDFVEISQPRTGLFADFRTINLDMFNMVSADALNVSAANVDIAGIYDTIMNAVKSVAGSDFKEVEQGIAMIETQTGVKIRQGLLESLSGQMVSYQPSGAASLQATQGGFVIIAGLKNVKLWQDSIDALGKFAAKQSNGAVQVSTQELNGRTLNTFAIAPLAMAQIMPTWTIVGENVVIGSSPTLCSNAVEQITSPGARSIRSLETFKKATENLPSNLISFQYTDSRVQLTQMMAVLQQLWPVATMYVSQQGITLPMVLPDISNIIKDVTPAVQYSWLDEKGIHSVYKGAGVEPSMAAIAGAAIGVGVTLPAIARTRQIANRMVSGTNLSAIGKAMLIYANDYDDKFPPNLQILVEKEDLSPKTLESKQKPANFTGPSYIYITGQTTSSDRGNVLVYENPAYCSEGVNVLFVDSHVEFMKKDQFIKALKATYQRLNKPMPEIKFKDSPVQLGRIN